MTHLEAHVCLLSRHQIATIVGHCNASHIVGMFGEDALLSFFGDVLNDDVTSQGIYNVLSVWVHQQTTRHFA